MTGSASLESVLASVNINMMRLKLRFDRRSRSSIQN